MDEGVKQILGKKKAVQKGSGLPTKPICLEITDGRPISEQLMPVSDVQLGRFQPLGQQSASLPKVLAYAPMQPEEHHQCCELL